ncbi:MAG: protein kinase [Polyangiaceae bacterium]
MSDPSSGDKIAPGTRLGRYELICPLARGGMATVWIARVHDAPGFDSWVAVKTILPQFADDPTFQSMFVDEARISSQIRHPNVAAVFDVGEVDGTLFLAMEWVDGDSWSKLHNAARRNGVVLPMNVTLRIAADVCAGLHAAHELTGPDGNLLQVVHRDVSPQNVLIGTHGYAKLIDFGVAKAVDRLANETTAGTVKGKVFYCAPEQALGRAVDRRADVWAVGAVLYKMLTGRLPFEAENELAMLHLLMSGASPHPLPSTTPASVAAIVNRALQREPARRFNTTLHMQQALEAAISEPTGPEAVAYFVHQHLGQALAERRRNFDAVAAALASAQQGQPVDLSRVMPPLSATQTGSLPSARVPAPSAISVSMVTPSALSAFSAISAMQVGDSTAAPPATVSPPAAGLSKTARIVIATGALGLLGIGVAVGASMAAKPAKGSDAAAQAPASSLPGASSTPVATTTTTSASASPAASVASDTAAAGAAASVSSANPAASSASASSASSAVPAATSAVTTASTPATKPASGKGEGAATPKKPSKKNTPDDGFLRMTSRSLIAALLLLSMSTSSLAWAEPSEGERKVARTLMAEGRSLRDEKDDAKGALVAFQKAHDIMHVPTTAIELVRTMVKLALYREALTVIAEVRAMPVNASDPAPFAAARAELDNIFREIDPKVAAITVTLSPEAEIREITLDGATVQKASLSAPLRLANGSHTFVAKGDADRIVTKQIEVTEGARMTVALTLPEKVVDQPPPASPSTNTTPAWRKPIPLAGAGVAGVGLILGTVTGAIALSKASSAKSHCVDNLCPPVAHDDVNSGRTFATVSTVSFIVAGVGAATAGVAIYLGSRKSEPSAPSVSLIVGPANAGLQGSF